MLPTSLFASAWTGTGTMVMLVMNAPLVVAFYALLPLMTLWSMVFNLFRTRFRLQVTREMFSPTHEEHTVVTRDGVRLRCFSLQTIGSPNGDTGGAEKRKVVLFCNPLGSQGLRSWASVIATCGEVWGAGTTFICWDYRGYFESDDPKRLRSICVRNHAEDAAEVLQAVVGDERKADLVVGHSMGVQVALEMALLYPEKVEALVLLNGTYGHALQTGFQPFVKLPYVGDLLCWTIRLVLRNGRETLLECVRTLLAPVVHLAITMFSRLFASEEMLRLLGPTYMIDTWNDYVGGICSNAKTTKAFLRGFQDLDAHTAAHHLHQLGHPTLLIAGLWDFLTPAYNMAVMWSAMPNARLVTDPLSSHFTVMEHPERVMKELSDFLRNRAPTLSRTGSFDFKKVQ